MPSPVAIAGRTANNSNGDLPPLDHQTPNSTAAHSVSSTASTIPPQTPFASTNASTQPIPAVSSPPAVTSPGLNPLSRWTTSGLSTFGKSPPQADPKHIDQAAPATATASASDSTMLHDQLHASARDIHVVDPNHHHHHHDDEHHFEQHDSFEFGDFGDMRNKSWTSASAAQKGRRAVSMSMASGQPLGTSLGSSPPAGGGPGSVMAMLTGFGSLRDDGGANAGNGTASSAAGVFGTSLSSSLGSPTGFAGFGGGAGGSGNFNNGVLADKAAKAQGVMRRLSLGGGFQRAGVMSPPQTSGLLPPSPPAVTAPAPPLPPSSVPATASLPPAVDTHGSADDGAKAAARGFMNRGRRYSESGGKKRGVSPMGERILRDHGHF